MKNLYILFIISLLGFINIGNAQVHTSYLWHLQQPIYWPEQGGGTAYQPVKESQDIKNSGGNQYGTGISHPLNNLEEIFSKDDRKNVYQHVPKNSVQQLLGYPEAGAQVNYSGCLIENINSLANANQWGYYSGWQDNFVDARAWQTSGGFPRLDIVGFTFHHALSPLITERAFRKELQAHKLIYGNTFGTSPIYTKGYWPAECCFSERNIKVLNEEGFEWSVIANSHLSRTLADYPLHYGTNGCNISPPNKADKVATNGVNWWNGQIDGRGGEFAAPYCYQAHKAKYIDPETGTEYIMDVVPMADLLSYRDGYSPQGTGDIEANIQPYENPAHPTLVLFAHDGDNAWGGGSSYYFEAVPNFVSAANNAGMVPTTIQQFLNDHPVPANDIVHVEDGGWVNAANDWGHPQFINWIWPLYNTSTYEFNPDGWTEDVRNWGVITAIDNFACMAEDLAGVVDINKVVYPDGSASNAEKAWHYYLPALTSGYMYYGTAEDMEVKQTIAGNNAIAYAQNEIDLHPGTDNTPPSVFIPQRFPYNPGAREFGPIYGYQEHISSKDFTVWTFGYDVNGITTATLKYRLDEDGENPISTNVNDTYTGGAGVSNWISISMTEKVFPIDNITGNPEIDFFVLPDAMSNLYYAEITGLGDTLVDYYVEMTDSYGNIFKTPIQHVYVGNEEGGSGNDQVYWEPTEPTLNDQITVFSTEAIEGSMLHWGVTVDGTEWIAPIADYWPAGTVVFDEHAVQTPFTDPDEDGLYTCVIGPFSNVSQVVEQVDFVIKISEGNWNNNGGQDFHITIENNPNENPVGSNQAVSMMMNETYNFSETDFYFQGVGGATFDGIQLVSIETNGDLKYNGTDVSASTDYPDLSLLTFTPNIDEIGSPYATFTFKVKDTEGRYSDNTYTMTINVFSYNPIGADASVTMLVNETYTFSSSNFAFTGMNGATFVGIQLTAIETAGDLDYDGTDITIGSDYSDMTLLSFMPETDEFGTPYATFEFKVKDNEGRYSDDNYTMTINVIESYPDGLSWYPENPTQNDVITIIVSNDAVMENNGGNLHWGVNGWQTPITEYQPVGTITTGGDAVETPFTDNGTEFTIDLGAFNNISQTVSSLDFVLHYGNNSWNNNSGNDWHIQISSVSINKVKNTSDISIYPNPIKDFAYIDIKSDQNRYYYIEIIDIKGKIVKSQYIGSAKRVILNNNLEEGIYIVKFIDKFSRKVITKKIVTL